MRPAAPPQGHCEALLCSAKALYGLAWLCKGNAQHRKALQRRAQQRRCYTMLSKGIARIRPAKEELRLAEHWHGNEWHGTATEVHRQAMQRQCKALRRVAMAVLSSDRQ